jgi:hypothetical protein
MKKIRAWLKTWWWVLLLIGLGCLVALGVIFGFFFGKPSKRGESAMPIKYDGWLPRVADKTREKVEEAETKALESRVEATVKAEEQVKQLEEIKKVPEGRERRRRLAAMLKNL